MQTETVQTQDLEAAADATHALVEHTQRLERELAEAKAQLLVANRHMVEHRSALERVRRERDDVMRRCSCGAAEQ